MRKYKKTIKVRCGKCNDYVDEDDTEFVNIEEGMQGEDILTFICPICNTRQRSRRLG